MRGAGIAAGSKNEIPGWLSVIFAQSSILKYTPPASAPPADPEAGGDPEEAVLDYRRAALLSSGPEMSETFDRSFWYYASLPEAPPEPDPGAEAPAEVPQQSASPDDDRVWPTPGPDDPAAKRVIEVTLTASEGTPAGVSISNRTKYEVSPAGAMATDPQLRATDAAEPQVLIIHTHGTESFLPDERDYYVPTDIERTEDTRYNVVRLGDEMEKELSALGLNVLHDRTIYDSPSYSGSYGRALASIEQYMKSYPSIQVVIDIHRDSIAASDGSIYKAVSETDSGKAAQMMIVVGSEGSGLVHPNWKKNLAFACDLDKVILDAYPTLMRPVNLRKERFNQHATAGSIILEVGTAGNTLSEALLSIRLFCETAGKRLAEQLIA